MNHERREKSWIWQAVFLAGEAVLVVFLLLRDWTRPRRRSPFHTPRWVRWSAGGFAIVSGVIAVAALQRYYLPPAPAQPIPFSHRIHVTSKKLDCFFCHTSATFSSNAGIPPVEKCLLCHKVIAPRFWPIRKIHAHYNRGEPIPWKRVNKTPQFVRFSHQPHLNKGIDCGECHGNVAAMDRVKQVHRFDMNFCVKCHWKNKASDVCITCHY